MQINNQGNGGLSGVASASQNQKVYGGGSVSAGFLKTLTEKMEAYLLAMQDSEITASEANAIESGMFSVANNELIYSSDFGGEGSDGNKVVYEGPSAYLFVSHKISDLTNLMSYIFTFENKMDQLFKAAQQMIGG